MSVTTKHASYLAYQDTWTALRDAYQGSGNVKTAVDLSITARGVRLAGTRYLPRPAGMVRDDQYAAYRDRAIFYGATERCVHGLTGAVFRREPQVENPTALDAQLEDVTQTGVPLRTFAEQAVRETLLMGRFGVLVDFPQPVVSEDGTAAPSALSRPYWIAYPAEEIINWRTIQRQGDTVLSLVVLKECVPIPQSVWPNEDFFVVKDQIQYRVLRLNELGIYEVSVWIEIPDVARRPAATFTLASLWTPTRNGEPLDFIPFVFMAPFSLEPAVEKSLLEALVEVNYQYYRHSADYEHGLHLTALPTAYICSGTENPGDMLIGSATAWWIPDSTATVGMLEFHGQGLQSHEHALENDIKNMAALGARLLEGAPLVQETATANLNRLSGAESPVQSLVTTVSHGLTQALQIHSWWDGKTESVDDTAIHLTLNTDLLAAMMEPTMLTALMQALLNGTISYETFYYNLQRGEIARPMVPVEEEQALLDAREAERPLVTTGMNGLPPTNGTTRQPRQAA
jgi:hypothetical protein